jgi:GH15 family glucan-1,4-alpha-glucosidase
MYPSTDSRIVATMAAIEARLWVKTPVGGLARYEGDPYRQVSRDRVQVPGNPWFVTTLWLAEWYATVAHTPAELQRASDLLTWVTRHALPSGVLAEQIHPYTGAPLSVSPLTWSHAGFVAAVHSYLQAYERLHSPATAPGGPTSQTVVLGAIAPPTAPIATVHETER